MSHEKISDFVSFSLFRFTLVINLTDFDLESHLNTLIVLEIKNDVRFDYVLPDSVWFGLTFVWVEFRQKVEKWKFWILLK